MKAEARRQRERENKIGDGGVYYTGRLERGDIILVREREGR
jgi:hypothetical protein